MRQLGCLAEHRTETIYQSIGVRVFAACRGYTAVKLSLICRVQAWELAAAMSWNVPETLESSSCRTMICGVLVFPMCW